jgi:hypothetical protein
MVTVTATPPAIPAPLRRIRPHRRRLVRHRRYHRHLGRHHRLDRQNYHRVWSRDAPAERRPSMCRLTTSSRVVVSVSGRFVATALKGSYGRATPALRRHGDASGASRRHGPLASRAAGPRRVAEDREDELPGPGRASARGDPDRRRRDSGRRKGGGGGDGREGEAELDSLDALLANLVAPRNDALIGRTTFRRAPIVLIEDRVVLGCRSDWARTPGAGFGPPRGQDGEGGAGASRRQRRGPASRPSHPGDACRHLETG